MTHFSKGVISQFKKLFLSLVFTVALCCGLSVSASANDNFYYNGVELPPLPSYILENYQYLDITHPTSSYYGLYGRTVPIYCKNGSTSFFVQAPFKFILYEITSPGGNWQLWSEGTVSDSVEYSANTQGSYVWSNYDILNIDTDAVAFYGSQPVPVDPPAVPTLSVTATDITSTSAQLNFTAENLDPAKQYQIRMEEIANPSNSGIVATFSGSETFGDSGVTDALRPDTTYDLRFTLIEDGVDTSVFYDLSFTTPPLPVTLYSYNGYLAPDSPIENDLRPPAGNVWMMYKDGGTTFFAASDRSFVVVGDDIIFRRDSSSSRNDLWRLKDGEWVVEETDIAPLTTLSGAYNGFIWSNSDVGSNSGTVYTATTFVESSEHPFYSFNGTVLPFVNSLPRTFRQHLLYQYNDIYYWVASDRAFDVATGGDMIYTGDDSTISVRFRYNGSEWEWLETYGVGKNPLYNAYNGFIWTQYNIFRSDPNGAGRPVFVGTNPVETDDPAADFDPVFSVSLNKVDSSSALFDVTVYNADPESFYEVSWSAYKSGVLIGSGVGAESFTGYSAYSGEFGFSGFASGTTYSILFDLVQDNTSLNLSKSVSFTTSEGVATQQPEITENPSSGLESDKEYGPLLSMILNELYFLRYDIVPGLQSIVQTLANPAEDKVAVNNEPLLDEVNNVLYNEAGNGNALSVSDIGDLADTQSVFKGIFSGDYGFSDFLGLFSDDGFFPWFSADTAMNLNPTAYVSPSAADLDDPYNMQSYYDNMEKVRNKSND